MVKRPLLADRLQEVKDRIAAAAAKAKRDPAQILLVAVTKSAAPEQLHQIIQLGITDIGESRVQQLVQRVAQCNELFQRRQAHDEACAAPKLRWHMIGHLQRNKIKPILPLVRMIHSVDSLRLAEELEAQAARSDRRVPLLMQVNASEEPTKSGVAVGAAVHLAEQIDTMPHLQIVGLMTMGPVGQEEAKVRQTFSRTRELFEEMVWQKIGGGNLRHLSMGMSEDFELAIAEGATIVRIGSLLFGGKLADHQDPPEE